MSTGYGTDMWCGATLSTGRRARGRVVVILALFRRLITPRGRLRRNGKPVSYGFDIADFIGAVGADKALIALPGIVRSELSQDDRVADVNVTASITTASNGEVSIELEIDVVLVDEGESFQFTVSANDKGAELGALNLPEAA